MSDEKDKKRRNMSRQVVLARKTLRKLNDIHEMVESRVLDALKVMEVVMDDVNQPGATRKAAAKEFLDLYWKFVAKSADVLGEDSGEDEDSLAVVSGAKFSVVPIKQN